MGAKSSPLFPNARTMEQSALPPAGDESGFSTRVRDALAWRWGGLVAAQFVTWTSTLLVVRLLDPSDYGLFAMSQVVLAALHVLNGYGFATSLIRADHVDERRIGQVFALLLLLNGGLAVFQFLMAPVAAAYYGQPMVADLLRVQSLLYATTPFIALPSALLARKIQFRKQSLANLVGATVGALVALGLAWFGFGVWALVYAPIVMFAIRGVLLSWSVRHLLKPVLDLRGAGDIVTFGGALTACQIFWIIQSQSDIFIAGRVFTPHDLGLYAEALFLTLIVTGRFIPPLNDVALPAYAELHKQGKPLAPFFLKTARSVLLVTAPIYVGLALTAQPAILLLFGEKWAEMAPIAAGLSAIMPVMALQIVCSPATNAMSRPRIYVMTSIAGAVLFPACFLFGISGGPMGLVHAWWVAAPLLLIISLALTLPAIQLGLGRLFKELAPVLLAVGSMALSVRLVDMAFDLQHPVYDLALLVPIGAFVYGAILWLFWPDVLRETWAFVRQKNVPVASPVNNPSNPQIEPIT